MKKPIKVERIPTGVRNLDALLGGGMPKGSVTVLAGTPGAGKTTLAQQICFHNISPGQKALVFQTLSEPVAKTMKYMSSFNFYDSKKLNDSIVFVDLGGLLRAKGLGTATKIMLDHIKRVKPALVVIDSFKVFEDLAASKEDLRKFTYEIAVQLMAWEITAFLLGEYSLQSIENSPLFSVVDGIITMSSKNTSPGADRMLSVLKMRGTNHDRENHPYVISADGVEIFSAKTSIPQRVAEDVTKQKIVRVKTGISGLDSAIAGGIPSASVSLISGASGSGKTLFALESMIRGASEGKEKGIIFSFELAPDELCTHAAAVGLDLRSMMKKGLVEVVYIPQSEIMIEKNLEMMHENILRLKAKRICIDSLSVFLERVQEPFLIREKVLQISNIVKSAGAVGLLTIEVPLNELSNVSSDTKVSVADAIFLLSSEANGNKRNRYLEIFKMRGTDHAVGRNHFSITKNGLKIDTKK